MNKLCFLLIFMLIITCEKNTDEGELVVGTVLYLNQSQKSDSTVSNFQFSNKVTEAFLTDSGENFHDPEKAINGVRGCGNTCGSTDVYSLRCDSKTETCPKESFLTLEWENKRVLNQEGIDFVFYGNSFLVSESQNSYFIEPLILEVGIDQKNWCGFSPDYKSSDELKTPSSSLPDDWVNFSDRYPVFFNIDSNLLSVTDLFKDDNSDSLMDIGGGEGYDLSKLSSSNFYKTGCSAELVSEIQSNGFIYLKISNAFQRENSDTGVVFPLTSGTFDYAGDVDGVLAKSVSDRSP